MRLIMQGVADAGFEHRYGNENLCAGALVEAHRQAG